MLVDTLRSDNYADFKQRYLNSFGFFDLDGTEVLCRITGVDKEKVTFDTKNNAGFWAFANQGVQFKFFPVQSGWYVSHARGTPILLMRQPARQYVRGISNSNTTVQGFYDGLLQPITIRLDDVESMCRKEQTAVWEKLGNNPACLSKFFAMGPMSPAGRRKLYFLDRDIGMVYDNKRVKLSYQLVQQELQDMINRNNYPLEIV